jgi:hypothetical protein
MKNHGSYRSDADARRGWFYRLFAPAPEPRPSLPFSRFWKIALRTVHLMAISVLVGGHGFGAPSDALHPWLYAAIMSGAGMIVFEAYPSMEFLFQGWGLLLLAKLALLCCIPFAWGKRFPILLTVVAIAAVASHLPRRFRHYSVLYPRVAEK